jgi:uncharacterized protein DUF4911
MMHTDSIQWRLEVNKEDIAYIVSIFDAYEELAVVRTLDQSKGLIELMISPDFLGETRELLDSLALEIPINRL